MDMNCQKAHFLDAEWGGKMKLQNSVVLDCRFMENLLAEDMDPEDTEELVEASYNPAPLYSQYNVRDYSQYSPYDNYLETGDFDDHGTPVIYSIPSDE